MACKACAVAGFVFCHLVHGVMDGVIAQFFGALGDLELARAGARHGGDAQLQAALGRYPWWRLPRMQAAFAFAMRFRLTGLQRLLVALRERV